MYRSSNNLKSKYERLPLNYPVSAETLFSTKGIPNVTGRNCFMSSIFQMLYCLPSVQERCRIIFRHPKWKSLLMNHCQFTEEEKYLWKLFGYLSDDVQQKEFLGLAELTQLYRTGWKNQTSLAIQDAGEFLELFGDFFLSQPNNRSGLIRHLLPQYKGKHLLYFHSSYRGEENITMQRVLDDYTRLLALEPNYETDAKYEFDSLVFRNQTSFWLEVDRGGESSVNEYEISLSPLVRFQGYDFYIKSVVVRLESPCYHYFCCVLDPKHELSQVYDDDMMYEVSIRNPKVIDWIQRKGRLYLFEKKTQKN